MALTRCTVQNNQQHTDVWPAGTWKGDGEQKKKRLVAFFFIKSFKKALGIREENREKKSALMVGKESRISAAIPVMQGAAQVERREGEKRRRRG